MKLLGKTIAILVEHEYQDQEVWYPYLRFQEEGATVWVVGTGSRPEYVSKYGYPITVDKTADQVSASQLHAIIVPGGWAPDRLRQYESVNRLVREMVHSGKVVGAICHAGSVLVSAGVLPGKTVTCFKAIKDDMIAAGANFVDQEVVVDGNLITSRKPQDLPAFCRAVLAALIGERQIV